MPVTPEKVSVLKFTPDGESVRISRRDVTVARLVHTRTGWYLTGTVFLSTTDLFSIATFTRRKTQRGQ